MGIVMINCPETRQAISTGIRVDRAAFHAMPVFSAARSALCAARATNGSRKMRGYVTLAMRIATRVVSSGLPSRER